MSVELPRPVLVRTFIELWKTTAGRDKFGRLVQFTCQLLAAYADKVVADPKEISRKLLILKVQFALSRKVFRMGKFFNFYDNLAKLLAKKDKPRTFILQAVKNIAYFFYMVLDVYNWSIKVKFIQDPDAVTKGRLQNWFWFLAITSSIAIEGIDIEQAKADGEDDAALDKRYMLLCKGLLDMWLPLANLKVGPFQATPGQAGILGTVSSLIAVYLAWPQIK